MLRKFFGCFAVAAAALLVGTAPTLAHDGRDDMCGGVMESDADMVISSSGKPLLLGGSAPCAQEVAAVEAETGTDAEPAAGPVELPHDGMVYFALDSDQLDAEDQAMLDEIVAAVAAQGPASVTVMGHADRSGGDDYNMSLSERRAQAIADALVAAGIPDSAINTMGYGETEPAVETEDGVAMRQNRRAAIEAQ
ncbi:MAG: OmpA family protein [Alphaproteobacteria bacterium]|nr:OmpA family protein [Alphaproteobacteria bacterium]